MLGETLQSAVANAVKKLYNLKLTPEISFPEPQFGDFSTNVAFQLTSAVKKSPAEIAQQIANTLLDPSVKSVGAAGAGFLNFTMTDKFWIQQLQHVDANYATSNRGNGKKVQVEFISANPTGPLTLGNARGGFIGDTLSNVLGASGYQVTREYYFNDSGSQIDKLVAAARIAADLEKGEPEYKGEYVYELAEEFRAELPHKSAGIVLTGGIRHKYLEPAIKRMGIRFDRWFNERLLVETGEYDRLEQWLIDRGYAHRKKDGSVWLLTKQFGDTRDRVIRKNGGEITYLGTDVAYHEQIFSGGSRGFDKAIKIWGADHAAQVPSLKLALENCLPNLKVDIEFIIYQFVRLMKDSKEVKMSKRAGSFVTVDDLLDEIPPDVARFFFLMRSSDTHMDFDLDLAKEQSQKNPYYYVMYSYVRAASLLQEAAKKGLKPSKSATHKFSDKERRLVRQLLRLPEVVVNVATSYGVHQLTFYGMELAKLFHDYYEDTRIINLPVDEARSRLAVIAKLKLVMETYFSLLGVKPLKRM